MNLSFISYFYMVNIVKKIVLGIIVSSTLLSGCNVNTDHLGADVYETNQLNSKQKTKTVNIISILPAKVSVDNSAQKESAKKAGSILGAVAGAVGGYNVRGKSTAGAIAGGVAGGVAGNVAGSMVSDKVIVEGVSLTYKEGNEVYTSTQAGKKCQFKPGIALIITTKENETRIQPNAECPPEK